MRALISSWALLEDRVKLDHLKLCYLWFDEVLFDPINTHSEDRYIADILKDVPAAARKDITDVILPIGRRVDQSIKGDIMDRLDIGYPRWGDDHENYDYHEPKSAFEFSHNRLLRKIEAEYGVQRFDDGYLVQQVEGRARVAVDAVALWERINSVLPCALQATDDEKSAMVAATEFNQGGAPKSSPFELFETVVPSFTSIDWPDVVELKRKGGFASLRERVSDCYFAAAGNVEAAKRSFKTFEDATVDEIVDRYRPNMRKIVTEAFLANVPVGMPLNPFGIFVAGRDTVQAIERKKDLGWLYMLRDIRDAARPDLRDR